MSQAQATAVEVVRWAVGPRCPAPAIGALDIEAVMELATYHRIEARLLARLETDRPAWCPARLLTRLRLRQHWVRQQAGAQMQAAREMSRAMRARGLQPPIFVKGFAAYALTARADGLHFSGDLDPFAEDLPAFWEVLHGLGYSGKRKHTHEWAKLHRNRITLDIHQSFPMAAYPPEVRALPPELLESRRNLGRWSLPAPLPGLTESAEPLCWEDLAIEAMPGAAEGTEELLFPSPTLLCLIHCAHCFRNCVTRLHYMDPRFRLCELFCISDLSQMPGFDADRFAALVDHYAAHDSVRLINTLAQAFLGARVLPERKPADGSEWVFPEHLIYGGWVTLQRTEDLLWKRGIDQMLHELDANIAPATCRLDARDVPRLLTYGPSPPLPQIHVLWNASQKSLTLDWIFPEWPAVKAEHELLLHFGYGAVIKVRLGYEGNIRSVVQKSDYGRMESHASAETLSADGSPVVHMTCAVPIWPDPSVAPFDSLPLFLAMRRLSSDGESTEAASYLPLRLMPEGEPGAHNGGHAP